MSRKHSSQQMNLQRQSYSLFETENSPPPTPKNYSAKSCSTPIIKCPKCGNEKVLKSARPAETGGTHYCCICVVDSDPLYFTPEEEKKTSLIQESPYKPYYQEENIIIYHGDAREVLMWIPTASIDLCITDPPYGVSYDGGTLLREELTGDHSTDLYKSVLKYLNTRCKINAALYLFYADGDTAVLTAVLTAGFEVRNTLIWNKNVAQNGSLSAQYKQKHEPFLYCHLKGEAPQWFGPTNEVTVWDCDRNIKNDLHPTQKPLDIMMRAIRNSSKPGDLVFDPFCGSGTTLRAAKDLGRRAIGIEIEEKYCEIAAKRMQQEVLSI